MDQLFALFDTYRWLGSAFGVMVLTAIVRYLATRMLNQAVCAPNVRTIPLNTLLGQKKPLGFGVWVIGISFAVDSMQLEGKAEIFSLTDEVRDVVVVWLMIWFAVNFTENVEKSVDGKHKHTVDATTATAVGKLLRASIIITGALMPCSFRLFDFRGAGFGWRWRHCHWFCRSQLGEFWCVDDILDRPFRAGDWVRSPDRDIEGTVESIGWRSRRFGPLTSVLCMCLIRSLLRYPSKTRRV